MPSYNLIINTEKITVVAAADMPLLWVLRDSLNLTGTKYGCGKGICGACTVHFNGEAIRACSTPIATVHGGMITTIEGISNINGDALQEAWKEWDVPQCGYCQSGQIMSASALLLKNPEPTKEEINSAMAGNICRCGTYTRIQKAIQSAANKLTE